MELLKVWITKKGEKAIHDGHPWIYLDEIVKCDDHIENGSIVDVFSSKNKYLGSGFFSEHSKIRIRILSRNRNDLFDEAFFRRRLTYAISYRRQVMGDDFDCCRLVFGEADGLPGLTVDLFHDILVTQVLSFGMEQLKEMIYRLLLEILSEFLEINGIYERNDVNIRKLEGLEEVKGWYKKADSTVTKIIENGIYYWVDVENGQKTGFFLDQKYNRKAVSEIAKNLKVLDCCTHTGSFALNAIKGGASQVTAVDISKTALEQAKENAKINGFLEKLEFVEADLFDYLRELEKNHQKEFDFIILDPPAFTKSRKTIEHAMRGYLEINTLAMKVLPRGGYLATASCSHFANVDRFEEMLKKAAHLANRQLREIEVRKQAKDHPILWGVEETKYLKFYLFQVI